MKKENKGIKWTSAVILYLSVVFFFLPYHAVYFFNTVTPSGYLSPVAILDIANKANGLISSFGGDTSQVTALVWFAIMFYIIPLMLTLAGAILLSLKSTKAKYVMAMCFSFAAVVLYVIYVVIGSNVADAVGTCMGVVQGSGLVSIGYQFGLIMNIVLALLGGIFPIFNLSRLSGGGKYESYIVTETGVIRCVVGMYANTTFSIKDDEEMILGRDSALAHIILDKSADKISRKHCTVEYHQANNSYVVTDYSANGTFVLGGSRLIAKSPTMVPKGTVICLGNKDNQFKLG